MVLWKQKWLAIQWKIYDLSLFLMQDLKVELREAAASNLDEFGSEMVQSLSDACILLLEEDAALGFVLFLLAYFSAIV